jgi:hypothetical protein
MPDIASPERYGREQGLLAGLRVALRLKFKGEGEALMPQVRIGDHERLADFLLAVEQAAALDDVRKLLASSGDAPAS